MKYEWPTTDNEDVAIFGREILIIGWAKNIVIIEEIYYWNPLFKKEMIESRLSVTIRKYDFVTL